MEGAHKYVFARAFRAPFPAHGWVFMLLLPSVLHPWLLSALTELGTPSPLRHEAPALLCWALGAHSSWLDGKAPLGLAVQDQSLSMCYVETQGMVVRRSAQPQPKSRPAAHFHAWWIYLHPTRISTGHKPDLA